MRGTGQRAGLTIDLVAFLSTNYLVAVPTGTRAMRPGTIPDNQSIRVSDRKGMASFTGRCARIGTPFLGIVQDSSAYSIFKVNSKHCARKSTVSISSCRDNLALGSCERLGSGKVGAIVIGVSRNENCLGPTTSGRVEGTVRTKLGITICRCTAFGGSNDN